MYGINKKSSGYASNSKENMRFRKKQFQAQKKKGNGAVKCM